MNPFVKILSLSLIITLTSSLVVAQDLKLEWVKTANSIQEEIHSFSIAIDKNGNVFTTGYFSGEVDFDPGKGIYNLTAKGPQSTFIQKLDSNGKFLWAKMIGNSIARTIDVDSRGNLLVTGDFNGLVDFNPGLPINTKNSTNGWAYVLKLDNAGNFKWAKNDYSSGFSIQADQHDNVVVLGYDSLSKLDSNGIVLWKVNHAFGPRSMAIDSAGNIALTGQFSGTVDFDPGPGTAIVTDPDNWAACVDLAVVKYDPNGGFLWVKSIDGWRMWGQSIKFDIHNNLVITGVFQGYNSVDFDPGPGNFDMNGDSTAFILKLNPTGNFIWARKIRRIGYGYSYTHGHSIESDKFGNLYIMGTIRGPHDMDPGLDSILDSVTQRHDYNTFLLMLDSNGNYYSHSIFNYSLPHGGWYYFWFWNNGGDHRLVVDDHLNIHVTGNIELNYYVVDTDFDPSPIKYLKSPGGKTDAFVQKLSQCTYNISHDTNTVIACNSFTWIDSLTYKHSDSNLTFVTGINCDFTFHHLNLKLIEADMDISLLAGTNTIEAEESNASYQWLDCNNAYNSIPNETSQTFTPGQNSNYAVEISKNGCVDTSACISVLAASIQSFGNEIYASIYPNPTSGSISIDLKGQKNISIRITDINGRLHYQTNSFNEKILTLNTGFAPGLYFVILSGENGMQREKLVVH